MFSKTWSFLASDSTNFLNTAMFFALLENALSRQDTISKGEVRVYKYSRWHTDGHNK